MNILPVSYVSQLGATSSGHNNDCGAASSLMLLNTYNLAKDVTVDQLYNSISPTGDLALSMGDMELEIAKRGLKTARKTKATPEIVFGILRERKPLLTLIHYAPLVDAKVTEKTGFRGAHFVVITGIDFENIFINDPYRGDGKTNIPIPINVFIRAWDECYLDYLNPVGLCVFPTLPIQDLSTPISVTDVLYSLTVNGINVRSESNSSSLLIRTIWKSVEPTIHVNEQNISNGYIQLADKSGWVYLSYLRKV